MTGVIVKDSSSFLEIQIVKLDTLREEGKFFQVYHLEIGNISESPVCIPVSHFGTQLTKSTVLVLDNPFNLERDFITLEDCFHNGYSHVCPSNLIVINPNTYFKVSFALNLPNSRFKNFHFDWTVVQEPFLDLAKKIDKGPGWKEAFKFNHKTVKLPK